MRILKMPTRPSALLFLNEVYSAAHGTRYSTISTYTVPPQGIVLLWYRYHSADLTSMPPRRAELSSPAATIFAAGTHSA